MSKPRKTTLTAAYLRKLFDYDPISGILTWRWHARPSNRTRLVGKQAGVINEAGYRVVRIGWRAYKAHRIAWCIVKGKWPKGYVRFKNGDKSDCRLANLREA